MATATRTDTGSLSAATATMSEKRDVSAKLKMLFPKQNPFIYLIGKSQDDKDAEYNMSMGKPRIEKREVTSDQPEWFTYVPPAVSFTVSSYNNGTATITFSSATELKQYDTLINTRTNSVVRVDSISTNDVVVTAIGFTLATGSFTANDVLIRMATAYHAGSTSPAQLSKGDDNNYNVIQIFREPTGITWSANADTYHYEENIFKLQKLKSMQNAYRALENSFIGGERPTSNRTTSGGATLTTAFGTMRGCLNWAQNSKDYGSAITPETFFTDLTEQLDESTAPGEDFLLFCGRNTMNQMVAWGLDKYSIDNNGSQDVFGVQFRKLEFGLGQVTLVPHDFFSRGSYSNDGLLLRTSELKYICKKGLDIQVKTDIEANDEHAHRDDLYGYVSLEATDGGRSMVHVKNMF